MRIEILVEETDDGRFRATYEGMPGSIALGGTFEQARQAMTEQVVGSLANMNMPCPTNLLIVATPPTVACLEASVPKESDATIDPIEEPWVEAPHPACWSPRNTCQTQSDIRSRQTTALEATTGGHNDAAAA